MDKKTAMVSLGLVLILILAGVGYYVWEIQKKSAAEKAVQTIQESIKNVDENVSKGVLPDTK